MSIGEMLAATVPMARTLNLEFLEKGVDRVRQVMWEYAGIDRTAKGLRSCLAALDEIAERLPEGATEEANLVDTARLIAEAALLRKESRGGHYRSDFPTSKRDWVGTHIEW